MTDQPDQPDQQPQPNPPDWFDSCKDESAPPPPPPPPPPIPAVVGTARALLQLAESGQLRGFIYAGCLTDGAVRCGDAGAFNSAAEKIGATAMLQAYATLPIMQTADEVKAEAVKAANAKQKRKLSKRR